MIGQTSRDYNLYRCSIEKYENVQNLTIFQIKINDILLLVPQIKVLRVRL